jgi:hypothetical protein
MVERYVSIFQILAIVITAQFDSIYHFSDSNSQWQSGW